MWNGDGSREVDGVISETWTLGCFVAHCALTGLPVWTDVNPVKRLEDYIPVKTGGGVLRR